MFRTYYCDRETATIHDIGVYKTREEAEAAAQEAYKDDKDCGELGERRYAVEDMDDPRDYDDQIVFPDVDADVDADDDDE